MWPWWSTLHYDTSLCSQQSVVVCSFHSARWAPRQPRPRCEDFRRPLPDVSQLSPSHRAASRSVRSPCPPSHSVCQWESRAWTWQRCVGCVTRCETAVCRATSSSSSTAAADKRHSVCCIRRQVLRCRSHPLPRCCPVWCHEPACNSRQVSNNLRCSFSRFWLPTVT